MHDQQVPVRGFPSSEGWVHRFSVADRRDPMDDLDSMRTLHITTILTGHDEDRRYPFPRPVSEVTSFLEN